LNYTEIHNPPEAQRDTLRIYSNQYKENEQVLALGLAVMKTSLYCLKIIQPRHTHRRHCSALYQDSCSGYEALHCHSPSKRIFFRGVARETVWVLDFFGSHSGLVGVVVVDSNNSLLVQV
jgi:hypothetical protein